MKGNSHAWWFGFSVLFSCRVLPYFLNIAFGGIRVATTLISGVANRKSIAYAVAQRLAAQGMRLILSYPNDAIEKRVIPIAEELGADLVRCDVGDSDSVAALGRYLSGNDISLNGFVHSIAYAQAEDLKGRFVDTSKSGFIDAMIVSVYSLVEMVRQIESSLVDGASIVTMSYLGANRVVQNYNVMGVAKAALESAVRYLASDFAGKLRINAVSAGPIKTLAASGIGDFGKMLSAFAEKSMIKRTVSQEDVAGLVNFLLSSDASGITGEVVMCDGGYSHVGM